MRLRSAPAVLVLLAGVSGWGPGGGGNVHAESEGWAALRQPGAIAIMRHALAPGTGDPPNFEIGDCLTQRTLDDRGREQARLAGSMIAERGIGFDQVLTSQWCRCRETARLLGLGPVEDLPALNSFWSNREAGPAQTDALRRVLAGTAGEKLMLVTHFVNIRALAGVAPGSGEIVVFAMEEGRAAPLGTVEIPVLGLSQPRASTPSLPSPHRPSAGSARQGAAFGRIGERCPCRRSAVCPGERGPFGPFEPARGLRLAPLRR